MKRLTVLSCILAASTLSVSARAASLPPLSGDLPAGALMTFETRNAGSLIGRLGGLVGELGQGAGQFGSRAEARETVDVFTRMLGGTVGQEAIAGVFTVSSPGGTFAPALLAVARPNAEGKKVLDGMIPKKKGARVGAYPFVRADGDVFVGQAEGVAYASTDKDLLMAYLGRLGGKDAPRLLNSEAYAAATRPVGPQEARMFVNFAGGAKVARSALAKWGMPRLLSPVVDALDTLGQWSGGVSTTVQGWNTVSAHLPNPQGRDRPLYAMLTPTTEFHVQDIIPGDAEAVRAQACDPGAGAYLGRWLTRVDLLDPLGFLSDTQLASHLERSRAYLGGECAQVTLAGGLKSGFNAKEPLSSLGYTVWYQRVQDEEAARAHLPEFARSVNAALAALPATLKEMGEGAGSAVKSAGKGRLPGAATGAAGAMAGGLGELDGLLKGLKFSYAFRGEYLVMALSDEAVQKALLESPDVLSGNADFLAAKLSMKGGGWQYARNLPDLTEADLQAMLPDGEDDEDGVGMMLGLFGSTYTELLNRYDGLAAQRTVTAQGAGHLIVNRSRVKYRW